MKDAALCNALMGCFTIKLFEQHTGLSTRWLVKNVSVTPTDDPGAGPRQWPVSWPSFPADMESFLDLQAAALMALFWRDSLADAALLSDAQRDALIMQNLIDEQAARHALDRAQRRYGAHRTNQGFSDARALARKVAAEKWGNNPDIRKLKMIGILRAELSEVPNVAMPSDDKTLWSWLKACPRRNQESVIPPWIQRAGRPKSKVR